MTASFAIVVCAHGAEVLVKESMSAMGWRLAFSRPGLVTAKHDSPNLPPPEGVFIRASFRSIGMCRGETMSDMLRQLRDMLSQQATALRFDHLHVFPKDRLPIGKFDFEPGRDELSTVIAETIAGDLIVDRALPNLSGMQVNQVAEAFQTVLDIVLVDASTWMIGYHRATGVHSRWPGGVQPIVPVHPPISRAYYKVAEAIAWSEFPIRENDLAVEIGSAPGGVCGYLLERGLRVRGVDPAEMDPRIASHSRFEHFQMKADELSHKHYNGARWMFVDSNVLPDQTLQSVENIITDPATSFEGLILTLKIGGYPHADRIVKWSRRIQSWGVKSFRVKQLARNKVEVCYAIEM
jgi:23S rRNA (cytidine2498-2'-O)-methyltransferase